MRLFELAGNNPRSKTAVFTFGRMNPPTIGHEVLVNKVKEVANKNNADHFIFLSQTHKAPKDPLDWKTKADIVKRAFPGSVVWEDPTVRTPFEALAGLGEDYDNVIMVVGSDRVEKFRAGMAPYLEEFNVQNFEVVSAGERDPDAEGAAGMSASKARALAAGGDWENFQASLPNTVSTTQKKKVYNQIRKNS